MNGDLSVKCPINDIISLVKSFQFLPVAGGDSEDSAHQ